MYGRTIDDDVEIVDSVKIQYLSRCTKFQHPYCICVGARKKTVRFLRLSKFSEIDGKILPNFFLV